MNDVHLIELVQFSVVLLIIEWVPLLFYQTQNNEEWVSYFHTTNSITSLWASRITWISRYWIILIIYFNDERQFCFVSLEFLPRARVQDWPLIAIIRSIWGNIYYRSSTFKVRLTFSQRVTSLLMRKTRINNFFAAKFLNLCVKLMQILSAKRFWNDCIFELN